MLSILTTALACALGSLTALRTRHHYRLNATRTDGIYLPLWGAFLVALAEIIFDMPYEAHRRRMAKVAAYEERRAEARHAAMLRHPSNHRARQASMANHPSNFGRVHTIHGSAS